MATELADGIWWFDLRGVNAYLLEDKTGATLIDAGGPWTRRALVKELAAVDTDPRKATQIALTHYDIDHVGGLGACGKDGTVYAGQPDADVLSGDRRPDWTNRKTAFQRATALVLSSPEQSIETVADGDRVGGLTVYETPGHTPGHLAFVSEERSVAFVGDLVREREGRLEASPWALSHDTDVVESSIQRLAELELDVDILAMGHGTPFVERGAAHLADLAARL